MIPKAQPRKIPWIFSQLGSREHYAIPGILNQEAKLDRFLTDFWARNGSIIHRLPGRRFGALKQRVTSKIDEEQVFDLGMKRVFFDLKHKLINSSAWETTELRNEFYQTVVLKYLKKHENELPEKGIFFSYSYTARRLFEFFKDRGWKCVLGQIDPGKFEEDLISDEASKFPEYAHGFSVPSNSYWEKWREELVLADEICINSGWSREALIKQGIPESKLRILPLAYEDPANEMPAKKYPNAFTKDRPLRVLFLGQANLRKGIHYLLGAFRKLEHLPTELDVVGPSEVQENLYSHSTNVRFHGPVTRMDSNVYYKNSDVFVLPTLSDGFAITQLEAQSWKLPLITSTHCAKVVEHMRNGISLKAISVESIAEAMELLVNSPELLVSMSENSSVPAQFSFDQLRTELQSLEDNLQADC